MAELDLDALQPEPHTVKFKGVSYPIPGEIALQTVIEAAQLQEKLTQAAISADTKTQVTLLERMGKVAMDLLRELSPDLPDLRLTPTDVGHIIGFIVSGEIETTDLDKAILDGLVGQADSETAKDDAKGEEQGGEGDGRPPTKQKAAGSRSRKRSPARSSA